MLKPSDIVQIPFLFSDISHQKRRPVLLLTAPDAFGDFLAAAVTIFMLSFLPCLTACAKDVGPPKPPINLPFEVQKSGSRVETEMRIVEEKEYRFALLLLYKKDAMADFERVRKLAGYSDLDKFGKLLRPGVPVLLKFKINIIDSAGERLMLEQDVSELRTTSMGSGQFNKQIVYLVLKPGHYRVSVESLRDVPELIGTPVEFQIGFYSKL